MIVSASCIKNNKNQTFPLFSFHKTHIPLEEILSKSYGIILDFSLFTRTMISFLSVLWCIIRNFHTISSFKLHWMMNFESIMHKVYWHHEYSVIFEQHQNGVKHAQSVIKLLSDLHQHSQVLKEEIQDQ